MELAISRRISTYLFAASWRSLLSTTVINGRDVGLRSLVNTATKVTI